ncbi:hypothetical protein D3H35_02170 [Cohnella faecalis]|uniref:Uncharacterized protein n=2 Tax=Cohnella faecalis TaxID=2315694 RepID=A0A398CNG0_9BACL|nr:hypothetical protein D3H35_29045 [Cohnella faecalis]RIE05197.1 hypothetical protein D3H35_02170 [Cohnella faecalis]
MAIVVAASALFGLSKGYPHAFAAGSPWSDPVVVSVRVSPDATYETRLAVGHLHIGQSSQQREEDSSKFAPILTDIYVRVSHGGLPKLYRLESSGRLWNEEERLNVSLPEKLSAKLLKEADKARAAHYGEAIAWKEAKRILPRKSVFKVMDMKTGLVFRVQRRAGSDHADVQPISREDTKIMNEIYGGQWSWNRKAVVVLAAGRRIAASMNGMPHGGDGIPDNGFSGHFCIHFSESTTHKSSVPDPAHEFMVHRAAGDARAYLDSASPSLLARSLVEALNQRDREWIRLLAEGSERDEAASLIGETDSVTSARTVAQRQPLPEEDRLVATLESEVAIERRGKGKRHLPFRFEFARLSPYSPWRLQSVERGPSEGKVK